MMGRNGHIIQPGMGPVMGQPAVVQMTPFNDTQLVAMIAAVTQEETVGGRVSLAMELVAESVAQMQDNALMKMIQERVAAKQQALPSE
jgi:hypothetical protein